MPPYGYFLIAHGTDYTGAVSYDMSWSQSLSGTGGTIFLVNNQLSLTEQTDNSVIVVDKVAYGTSVQNYLRSETLEFLPAPSANQSLERKANYSSSPDSLTTGADKYLGNGWDSDNNSQDFVLRSISEPQNSQSPVEPRFAPAKITNFSAAGAAGDSRAVKLTWTAPYGAFGNPGNLSYDIRYSTSAINSQNFISATPALSIPSVGASGAAQELTIGNLSLGQTYYFAIKTKDITGGIAGPESEISFASYDIPSPVFLQNLVMTYFASSANNGSDGFWPQVSQTIGTGLNQRLVKATARVKCNSNNPCNISYKSFAVNGYYNDSYSDTQIVQGSGAGFSSTGGLGNDPSFIPAGADTNVNFSGWDSPAFNFTFNPYYYYKITFQFNTNSPVQWGGSVEDSYANGYSTPDYSGGSDLYFKLSTE